MYNIASNSLSEKALKYRQENWIIHKLNERK
jgi:hypothetical protein